MGQTICTSTIEKMICSHPLVLDCVIVGEHESYYAALVSPDKDRLALKLNEDHPHERHQLDRYQRLNHIDVRKYFCDLLEETNTQLGSKRVERFALLELDSSKSRAAICAENRPIIESLYQDYIPGIG